MKRVIYECSWCTRMRGKARQQIMADLPSIHLSVSCPFSEIGVDFAGLFTVKCTNHRSMKHLKYYAAVFICLSTHAILIKTVFDLTTKAFITSLQCFCARRGILIKIWLDNAKNFTGTKHELKKYCQSAGITWKFIPPLSPHQGSIWESAVKAGKKIMLAAM